MARSARPSHVPISLAADDAPAGTARSTLPERVARALRDLVATGALAPGDQLPSTRTLAHDLGISRGSVVAAFEQLASEGYLVTVEGGGTRIDPALIPRPERSEPASTVQPDAPAPTVRARHASSVPSLIDLRPGTPPVTGLPTPGWRRAWREAADEVPPRLDAGGLDARGCDALRRAAADRLRRARAVAADPRLLFVTAGARDGLRLVLEALSRQRARRGQDGRLVVGVESPGYPSLRRIPELLGHRVVGAPVDAHGLDPDRLPQGLDALIATPSHQHPIGGSLSAPRRLALLARAREQGILLIEDDHTGELRWEGAPLPALAGLDDPAQPCVALLTSWSALLGDAVAAGHVLVPAPLADDAAAIRAAQGPVLGAVAQGALARFLDRGELERLAHRARTGHRRRRDLLLAAVDDAPGLEAQPVAGGLIAVVRTARPEQEVLARAATEGVLVGALDHYWSGRSPASGVVIGFGGSDEDLTEGLARLARAART